MLYVGLFLLGVLFGGIVTILIFRYKRVGRLMFYQMEPSEPPVMMSELYEPVEDVIKHKYVLFDVSRK